MLDAFSLPRMPLLPMLAAISVSYALGEGLGRIACISFGCCYGKPVTSTNGLARKVFTRLNFVFEGTTKKIAYESGMDGVPVVPIQALTATLYVLVALFSFWLFMRARFTEALLIAMGVTQLWRAFSETLRADYRGGGAVSIYQFLALASLPLTVVYTVMFAESGRFAPDLGQGIAELWSPGSLIALQFLGVAIFLYTGRSEVTESQLQIQICRDKI
jgi:prolipoprotein diacylglyceryltransferase